MVIPLEGNERYQSTYQRVVCWWSTFHIPSLEVTKTLFLLQFQFTIFIFFLNLFCILLIDFYFYAVDPKFNESQNPAVCVNHR